jgi:D-glycero-D-manno-heptose 1,7-bisphosphate phosphatase
MNRAVFLDRDGVINAMVYNVEFGLVDSPANPREFTMLPGVPEAIRVINALGFLAVVISNQPGIAKGKFSVSLLEAMTHQMVSNLAAHGAWIDSVYYCYHHPEGVIEAYRKTCDCRKPKPGMLLRAAKELDIALDRSYLIGDGITDMQAGKAAGTINLLVYPSFKCYICEELNRHQVQPHYIVPSLHDGVKLIQQVEMDSTGRLKGDKSDGNQAIS